MPLCWLPLLFRALGRECCDLCRIQFYPPHQWLPGIFLSRVGRRKNEIETDTFCRLQCTRNTTRDTGWQTAVAASSHRHTISGIIKVVYMFFVLLTAVTSINPYLVWCKRNVDGRERRNSKKPQRQGRELLKKKNPRTIFPVSFWERKTHLYILNRIDILEWPGNRLLLL